MIDHAPHQMALIRRRARGAGLALFTRRARAVQGEIDWVGAPQAASIPYCFLQLIDVP